VHCRHAGRLSVRCEAEGGRHDWRGLVGHRGGIAPFLAFRGEGSRPAADRAGFGEPDVWVVLEKRLDGLRLDAEAAPDFRVLARAQVYYHRPGAWQEPPNLFNPFWAARLAPTDVLVTGALAKLGLGDELARLLSDALPALMH
jgi:hypothetical protein